MEIVSYILKSLRTLVLGGLLLLGHVTDEVKGESVMVTSEEIKRRLGMEQMSSEAPS